MHIITGKYKGRSIETDSKWIRPTMAKTRAAFFSSIGERIINADFLDLFCGSAAMSIEALSRGARRAVGVDLHIEVASRNKESLSVESLTLYRNDSLRAIAQLDRKQERFDLVYIDPPYDYADTGALLLSLSKFVILNQTGLLCFETAAKSDMPQEIGQICARNRYDYGQTKLTIYQCKT